MQLLLLCFVGNMSPTPKAAKKHVAAAHMLLGSSSMERSSRLREGALAYPYLVPRNVVETDTLTVKDETNDCVHIMIQWSLLTPGYIDFLVRPFVPQEEPHIWVGA